MNLTFSRGLRDGLPIALGYLSVSFAFGMTVVNDGLPIWTAIVTSLTNFTGTGQFTGMKLLATGASLLEITFTVLVINIRYLLMSFSLSQRLPDSMGTMQRLALSFGITDEVFGVAMSKGCMLNFKYVSGIMLSSYTGWMCGTVLGACISTILPEIVSNALSLAIYAMFLAIIVPPMPKQKPIAYTVVIAASMSTAFYFLPYVSQIPSGFRVIICGVFSSVLVSLVFPVKVQDLPPIDGDNAPSDTPKEHKRRKTKCVAQDNPCDTLASEDVISIDSEYITEDKGGQNGDN